MEDNKIILNEDGKEVIYRVVLNIEDVEGKNYVVYTKDDDGDDTVECYASEYKYVKGKLKLTRIKTNKEFDLVNDVLSSLENAGESNGK